MAWMRLWAVVLAAGVAVAGCNKRTSSESETPDGATETQASSGGLPAGHPDISQMGQPATQPALPAGHPPIPQQQTPPLPAGHPAIPPGMMAGPTTLPADGPISWTLPAGWTQQAGSPPRYAVLTAPADRPAELVITSFPGDVGGVLANVNRWRGQVGAAPIAAGDLDKYTTRVEANGVAITVTHVAGPKPEDPAMLAAIVPDGQMTWFFKLVGAQEDVKKNEDDFMQLVKSIRLRR